MKILFAGVWPSTDADGNPFAPGTPEHLRQGKALAGGWKACLWIVRGDLEFFSSALGLESSTSKHPCFVCRANDSDIPWTDSREGIARWEATVWSKSHWEHHRGDGRHILFRECPGVSITSVMPDLMHTKHLGVDQYYYGSVLRLLTHSILRDTHENNLSFVWSELQKQYQSHETRYKFNTLKFSMFLVDGDFPKLKGRAAEVRCVGKPLTEVFRQAMNTHDPIHRLVYLGLTMLTKMEDIVATDAGYSLSNESHKEFVSSAYSFLAILTKLGHHFHGNGPPMFHFTIKCHYLLHIAKSSKWIHPALSWCYSGEDFCKASSLRCEHCALAHMFTPRTYDFARI